MNIKEHHMSSNGKKHVRRIALAVLVILFIAVLAVIFANRFKTDYDQLSRADQRILSELDAYCTANEKSEIWDGYALEKEPLLLLDGGLGKAYLVNPTEDVESLFATEISMPADSSLQVYRIAALAPQTIPIRLTPGNFNTTGESYTVFGNDVYFLKYDKEDSLEPQYSSRHFMTFLSHEAFHYYMQKDWKDGGRFSGELSATDLDLLTSQYEVLAKVQEELRKGTPSKALLKQSTKAYIALMEQRITANPKYLEAELSMETAEGTAQYVGIKASEIVGYDYGTMYFDNRKNVSFAEVLPMVKAGGVDQSFLADRMPYDTGSLLCLLLDALEVPDWKEKLNRQTTDKPIYLYHILKNYMERAI